MENFSDRLIYMPNRRDGECLFNGKPTPTDEILEIIGQNGVRHIHKRLAEIVGTRKELFGDNQLRFYGLHFYQQFYDLQEQTRINVIQALDNRIKSEKQPYVIEKGRTIDSLYSKKNHKDFSDKAIVKRIKSGSWIVDSVSLNYIDRVSYKNIP